MTRHKDDPASAESWTVPDGRAPLQSAATAPSFSPGDVLAERYALRRVLGRGGMGVVFEAHDRVLDQVIALKIVRAEYAGERAWAERLAREVKLARQINHPNICRVFDIGMAERHPFLTMELASRGTLRDEIASGEFASRSLEERLSDVRAIASGLAAIHAAGIIHRDVAPQNVLRMGDGSLVLSDFGLATDRFDGTSSIQGGTLTYMAPEVVRGARASMASDMWSLGLVIHELVFGARPRWSTEGSDLLAPHPDRRLSLSEKYVLQVCRACLAEAPAARARRADKIAQWLSGGVPMWRRRQAPRILGAVGVMLFIAAVGLTTIGRLRLRAGAPARADATDGPMLLPAGTPEDWTSRSRVLAEIPDRIACMVPLPDGESVRFGWGHPLRVEDVNVRTGVRTSSPLVAQAFAEGCPDTTRDGRVVFAGHRSDGRPFAFVSQYPDGHAARPIVPIAEPSVLSDPVWLADGDQFLYSIDMRHDAVYSVSRGATAVLSNRGDDYFTLFHSVAGNRVIAAVISNDWKTDVQEFSPPSVEPDVRFRVPFFTSHVQQVGRNLFVMPEPGAGFGGPMVVVDAVEATARRVGFIPEQALREPVIVGDNLVFWGSKAATSLSVAGHGEVAVDSSLVTAARCGTRIVGTRVMNNRMRLVWLRQDGQAGQELDLDDEGVLPRCSPDARVLFYLSKGHTLRRCEGGRCSTLATDVYSYSLSPSGHMIAALSPKNPSLVLDLIDSSGTWRRRALLETANGCYPLWASEDRLWVSLRAGSANVWKEFAMPAGVPTGRTSVGQSDCTAGNEDPASPVKPEVWLIRRTRAQLQMISVRLLKANVDRGLPQ